MIQNKDYGRVDDMRRFIIRAIALMGLIALGVIMASVSSYAASGYHAPKMKIPMERILNIVEGDHAALGSERYVERIRSIESKLGARAAFSAVMDDVDKHGSDLDHGDRSGNGAENISRFHKMVSALVYRIGYVDEEMHYFRNRLNRVPDTLKDLIRENRKLPPREKWSLLSARNSIYHLQGDGGEYNLKFVSYDGYHEAVYNREGLLLSEKNNPVDMGTYNYAAGIRSADAHKLFDVNPYITWGNTPDSPQKGAAAINAGTFEASQSYKKNEYKVFEYRNRLFGMQQGKMR